MYAVIRKLYHKSITIFWYHKIDFMLSLNRFGILFLKKKDRSRNIHTHVRFHSYGREKLIARAFAARLNGPQIIMWASTWDLDTVAEAQTVQLGLARCFRCPHICHSNRHLSQHMGLWYLSYFRCRVPKAQVSLRKYADTTEPSLFAWMSRTLLARDFGNVITLSSDEGSGVREIK